MSSQVLNPVFEFEIEYVEHHINKINFCINIFYILILFLNISLISLITLKHSSLRFKLFMKMILQYRNKIVFFLNESVKYIYLEIKVKTMTLQKFS